MEKKIIVTLFNAQDLSTYLAQNYKRKDDITIVCPVESEIKRIQKRYGRRKHKINTILIPTFDSLLEHLKGSNDLNQIDMNFLIQQGKDSRYESFFKSNTEPMDTAS